MNALATSSSLLVQPTRGCVTDFHRLRDALDIAFAGTLFHGGEHDPRDIDELVRIDAEAPRPCALRVEDWRQLRGYVMRTVLTVYRNDAKRQLVCETSVCLTRPAFDPRREPVTLAVLFKRLNVQGTSWSTPEDMPAWRLNVYDEGRAAGLLGRDHLAELVPNPHGLPPATQRALADKIRRQLSGNDRRYLTEHEADLAARTLGAALRYLASH